MGRGTRRKLNENVQEGDRDEEQVHMAPENCIQTPEGDGDEEQVHTAPENCIEFPEGDRDHEQVQRHPESHMQVTRDRNNCRQVPSGDTNHLQVQRSVGRNRDPSSQLWQRNCIYPSDDFRPKNINFTGNEEILERLPRNVTAEDYFKWYNDDKMSDYTVTQTNLYAARYLEKE